MTARCVFSCLVSVIGLILVSATPLPELKVQGSRVTLYDRAGHPIFRTVFASVEHKEDGIQFASPNGQLFTEGGPINIEASEGSYVSASQILTFVGSVEGDQPDLGLRFNAETIHFSLETREAFSEKNILIQYGPFSITGRGFSMNLAERRLVVRGEVNGSLAEAD